jgi:hypothetical protein
LFRFTLYFSPNEDQKFSEIGNGILSSSEEAGVTEDTFGMIGPTFVEAVHVELSDERVHFAVAEVPGQDDGLELVDVLDDEL